MTNLTTKSERTLHLATVSWIVTVALSQLLFLFYIVKFYFGNAVHGNIEAWNEMTIKGYVTGDSMGNVVFASHLVLAVILTLGGLLQLIPWIRENALTFHKYNGRLYIFNAMLLSLGGLYLVWVREATLSFNGTLAITLNAILIILFSVATIVTARSGQLKSHRKWALRTFMVVSGVWFFRVGFMAWILIHQEAKWSTENLDGPFDLVWAFANYLIPLALLELYFFIIEKRHKKSRYLMAAVLMLCTVLVILGTLGAYLMMWGPNI